MFKPITKLLLAAAVTAVCATTADAYTLKLTIDDPANVSVADVYGTPITVHAGENTFTDVPQWTRYNVSANRGYILKDVISGGNVVSKWAKNYEISVESDLNVSVVSAKLTDVQTGSFTVNVDNPQNVRFALPGTNEMVSLNAGANTVKFIPDADKSLTLSNSDNSNMPFYKVTKTVGGTATELPFENQQYQTMISEGMVLDILVDYPADLNYTVSFQYANEGTESFMSTCTVGGQPLENFRNGFTAHAGQMVYIQLNKDLYNVNTLTLNGTNLGSYASSISFPLDKDYTIVADVTKYNTYNVTINANDPSLVSVHLSYASGPEIPLTGTTTTAVISESNNFMLISPKKGYMFTTCTLNGEDMTWNQSYNAYTTNITADCTINIEAAEIEYDNNFVVFVQGLDQVSYAEYMFSNALYEYYTFNEGYNTIGFMENEAPFRCSPSASSFYPYLNNEPLELNYYGSGVQFTPANNDVYKFYFDGEPTLCTVNFTIEGDAARDAAAITGKYDIVKDIDFSQPLTTLSGTGVEIFGSNLGVTVDGTAVEPVEGIYAFTVTGNNNVVISNKQVGIDGINADQKANNVYNLQGILMIRNASEAQIQALPAGMYIINGKKFIKK